MKTLLIGEYKEGKLLDSTYELIGFAEQMGGRAPYCWSAANPNCPPAAAPFIWQTLPLVANTIPICTSS